MKNNTISVMAVGLFKDRENNLLIAPSSFAVFRKIKFSVPNKFRGKRIEIINSTKGFEKIFPKAKEKMPEYLNHHHTRYIIFRKDGIDLNVDLDVKKFKKVFLYVPP